MAGPPVVGGVPAVTLRRPRSDAGAQIVEATVLPGRGCMLLQATAELPDGRRLELLHAPDLAGAAAQLDGGPDDFAGNRAFAFGGAILAPYANRIRGRALPDRREIETHIRDHIVRLPRNWGGRAPGAETYAMHGLILAEPVACAQVDESRVVGRLAAIDPRWPGALELSFAWGLEAGGLRLQLQARNTGAEPAPFGAGWHPYVRVPSGERAQARLRLPARLRTEVNNYDEVLPTGRRLAVEGTPYDFRDGAALGDLYLDDCFTGLADGPLTVELCDPAGAFGLRVAALAPPVRAVQVYAPRDQAFVVVEPQFNLANPFGPEWGPDADTGMVWLQTGQAVQYDVTVSVFAI